MEFFQVFLGPMALGLYFYLDLFHGDQDPSFLSKICFFGGMTSSALFLGIINYHWFQFKNDQHIFLYFAYGAGAGASLFLLQKTTEPFSFSPLLLLNRSSLFYLFIFVLSLFIWISLWEIKY